MAAHPQDITFIIPGQAQTAGAASRGSVKTSVRVSARPGDDVVVLSIANGPTLYLHPEGARAKRRRHPRHRQCGQRQRGAGLGAARLARPGGGRHARHEPRLDGAGGAQRI